MRGRPATHEMDLWRIPPGGGTRNNSPISTRTSPTQLRSMSGQFCSWPTTKTGPAQWLWTFDMVTRTSRRVSSGLEQYAALSATADGQRLAANVVNPTVSLWSVPIAGRCRRRKGGRGLPITHGAGPGAAFRRRIVVLLVFAGRGGWTVELSRWASAGDLERIRRRATVASGRLGRREERCLCAKTEWQATDACNGRGWNPTSSSFDKRSIFEAQLLGLPTANGSSRPAATATLRTPPRREPGR